MPCNLTGTICAERVVIGSNVYLPVFSTHELATGDEGVSRGLIVVHGNNRTPDTYFLSGIAAVTQRGVAGADRGRRAPPPDRV